MSQKKLKIIVAAWCTMPLHKQILSPEAFRVLHFDAIMDLKS